jgi:hypothetical protein
MHGTINVKSPNNTIKWQMGFNSTFKGLMKLEFSQLILKNPPISIFIDITSSGDRVVP